MTGSPRATLVTPAPTSTTTPAPSCPKMTGKSPSGSAPERVNSSVWQTPVARSSTSTSPALGPSRSTVSTTSGLPFSNATAARVFIPGASSAQRLHGFDDALRVDAEPLHHDGSRGAHSEAVDAYRAPLEPDPALPPESHAGLDRDPTADRLRKYRFTVPGVLPLEASPAGQGHYASPLTELLCSGDAVLHFAAGSDEDGLECARLFHEYVAATTHPLALCLRVARQHRNVLTRQGEQRGTIHAFHRRDPRARGLLGIGRANDVEVRDHAQAHDGLDGLVRRAVLAHADRVVREYVGHGQMRKGGEADARAHVVGEHEERRA